MKTFFNKNKWPTLLVILLIVLNISILATFLFRSNRYRNLPERPLALQSVIPNREGIFLRNELGLDDSQYMRFQNIRDSYQRKAAGIETDIQHKKDQLLDEMVKAEPDSERINRIENDIGQMHAQLLSETGNYYFKIRDLCNEEQKERLDDFFSRVITAPENNTIPDRRLPYIRGRNGRLIRPGRN